MPGALYGGVFPPAHHWPTHADSTSNAINQSNKVVFLRFPLPPLPPSHSSTKASAGRMSPNPFISNLTKEKEQEMQSCIMELQEELGQAQSELADKEDSINKLS